MKLNSRAYFFIVLVSSIVIYVIFRSYKFMISPPPKNYNVLKVGDIAPDFDGKFVCNKDKKENSIKLYDILKDKGVILYFYPKDNTKFCSLEAQSFINHYNEFKKIGYDIIGVSSDSAKSHEKFINDFKIPYKLICDTQYSVHKKYGACSKKPFFGRRTYRMTFIIDKSGKISDIITNVQSKSHAQQVLKKLKKIKK